MYFPPRVRPRGIVQNGSINCIAVYIHTSINRASTIQHSDGQAKSLVNRIYTAFMAEGIMCSEYIFSGMNSYFRKYGAPYSHERKKDLSLSFSLDPNLTHVAKWSGLKEAAWGSHAILDVALEWLVPRTKLSMAFLGLEISWILSWLTEDWGMDWVSTEKCKCAW